MRGGRRDTDGAMKVFRIQRPEACSCLLATLGSLIHIQRGRGGWGSHEGNCAEHLSILWLRDSPGAVISPSDREDASGRPYDLWKT